MSEFNINEKNSFREKVVYLLFALFLGIVFDRIFIGNSIGLSHVVFVILVIVFFIASNRSFIKLEKNIGLMFLGVAFLLSLYFAIRTNVIILAINFILVPIILIAISLILTKKETKWDTPDFIFKILNKGIIETLENFDKPIVCVSDGIKNMTNSSLSSGKKQVIKGLLISLPLLIVVLVLLSSADLVFNYYILNFTDLFKDINLNEFIAHTFVVLFITIYLFSYVWSFKTEKVYMIRKEKNKNTWEAITNVTVIMVIDLVYLAFTLIQFSYLYGGGGNSLPSGFTYAEYARRGFFELVTVSVINYVLVLLSLKNVKESKGGITYTIKILVTLLIIFTLSMLFSAHYKLSLYEISFGFTYLRVYVHLFMIVLLVLCILAAISIWINKFSLSKSLVITLILGYTIVSYINIDAFIAKKNIERYKNTDKIDARYLTTLSYEAVPYIIELAEDKNAEVSRIVKSNLEYRKSKLDNEKSIFEFNLSKHKVRNLLKSKGY